MTALLIEQETPPLRTTPEGVVYVGASRVPLETVVFHFDRGETAETIARKFPTLTRADVYATLAYVLRHREEVDEYLQESERQAEETRRFWEERNQPASLKETLLERQEALKGPA